MSNKASVFVSYSRRDIGMVAPVVKLLRAARDGVFQDIDGIRPGHLWREKIEEAILSSNLIIVFWCRHSASSEEVKKEYEFAIAADKAVTPILLDRTPLPGALSDYQAVDFQAVSGLRHRTVIPFAAVALGGAIITLSFLMFGLGPEEPAVVARNAVVTDPIGIQWTIILGAAMFAGVGLLYAFIKKRRIVNSLAELVTKVVGSEDK